MPRRRATPRLPPVDRDRLLAEEVFYLHSLWRLGPPAPQPAPAAARATGRKRKRRRHERASASEPLDAGPEWPMPPSPPASSPRAWPEAAASTPAKPPPPPSPGTLAHREALRAAAEFFSSRGSDDEDGSGSEGDDEEGAAAGFLTGLFERDAALRGHYERGWEEGWFACMACAAGRRKAGRRFRGCVALVQHARAATRYGRPRAHRALAAVVCRVLGWDIERLPSIVIDPRGTLGQALAAEATVDVQLAKDNDDTGEDDASSSGKGEEKEYFETVVEDSSSDGDEEAKEPDTCEDSDEKEAVEIGTEDPKTTGDEEAIELNNSEKSVEKEGMEEIVPPNFEEISKNEVLQNETVQEVSVNKDDSLIHGNNGEVHEQEIDKKIF